MKLDEYFRVSRKMGVTARAEATLLVLLVTAAAFEGVGIGMLLPIFSFVQSAGDMAVMTAESSLWAKLIAVFNFLGIPVTLASLIIISFASIIVRQAVSYIRQIYMIRLREDLVLNACNHGFRRYLDADTAYHDQEASGNVVNSMTTELRLAVDAIMSPIQILSYTIMMLFYVGLLMFLTGPVTVVVMVVLGFVVFLLRKLIAKTTRSGEQLAQANKDMSAFLVQRLGSVRLVRLAGTEQAELDDLRRHTENQRGSTVRMRTYLCRVDILIEPLALGIGFVMLYFGVTFFAIGIEEIGLVAVVAMMRLMPTVKEVLRTNQTFRAFLGSLYSFERRLDNMEKAREHRGGDRVFNKLRDAMVFHGVGFQYQNNAAVPALHGLDLSIPAGRMTALVGPSGAGKSTLVDLLPRLRDPTEGVITLDGQPLKDFTVDKLRGGISYVSQQPIIFNVTVAQHIRYGKSNASDAEVRTAAELAGAAEFIKNLPEGYDTMLGEDGVRLSGGQRQRLDLARALVLQAPILILDEPTSNLDAESEEHFREVLNRIRRETGATIIVIAHRLSTVSAADQIVTLENGRAVQTGTHAELVAVDGWYANAYAQQVQVHGENEGPLRTVVG